MLVKLSPLRNLTGRNNLRPNLRSNATLSDSSALCHNWATCSSEYTLDDPLAEADSAPEPPRSPLSVIYASVRNMRPPGLKTAEVGRKALPSRAERSEISPCVESSSNGDIGAVLHLRHISSPCCNRNSHDPSGDECHMFKFTPCADLSVLPLFGALSKAWSKCASIDRE